MSKEFGYFEGIGDEILEENKVGTHYGITKRQWLTDPKVKGSKINDHHSKYVVGHIVEPKISKSLDSPYEDMLAFRGAIDLSNDLGKSYYDRIQRNDPTVGLSIEYTADVEITPKGSRISNTKIDGVGKNNF
jgi:hypothetical protein